jgi:predicted acetyltransferase
VSQIKKLPKKDIDVFLNIAVNAYPGMKIYTDEEKRKLKRRVLGYLAKDPTMALYGLYRKGKLLGGMSLHDFTMTLLSAKASIGGVGFVAVDLSHKKEKVCKELIVFFLQHYRRKGATMTALYPFRPDFYRKMGFGYGTKISHYRIKPADLPRGKSRDHIRTLQKRDQKAIVDCYNRYAEKTHGMMRKSAYEIGMYAKPSVKVVGYKRGSKIQGYVAFSFRSVKESNFVLNDLIVEELIYENPDALSELMAFLHTQADQIDRIVFNTHDEHFHFLPHDPRDGSENLFPSVYHESNLQGVGIMYRVIDTTGLFRILKGHSFGNQNCKLKMSITDSFFGENQGNCIVHFVNGKPRVKKAASFDVEIKLDVSDFSSLVMGAVDFRSLHSYGLAEISDDQHVGTVNRLFLTEEKPRCMTHF